MNLGAPEILLIMLVILIFFGPKKIPDLARGLGQGLREIQDGIEKELKIENKETPKL